MDATLPMLAGTVSTAVFAGSMVPMLHKALRTRELSSYSLGNIALANVGNAVHSVYVFHLPPGPIWLLHSFYMVTSALMLYWYLRCRPAAANTPAGITTAALAQRGRPLRLCAWARPVGSVLVGGGPRGAARRSPPIYLRCTAATSQQGTRGTPQRGGVQPAWAERLLPREVEGG